MTMTMTSSQFGLEDMEALLWGPTFPMADAMDILSECPDQEDMLKGGGFSLEGGTLPPSPLASSSPSSSSSSSPSPFYSPPSSPLALAHGDKAGPESDLLTIPMPGHSDQLRHMVPDDSRGDLLSELDWMAERVDLSEFDLDSLIGSCSPSEDPPSSPEDFLAALDCPMELDSLPLSLPAPPVLSSLPPSPAFHASPPASPFTPPPTISSDQAVITVDGHESYVSEQNVPSSPVCVPEPQEELEIKSEPTSPEPASPAFDLPPAEADTLDLGSEVDISESEVKPAMAPVIPQVQRVVLSLSPPRIVLVLAPKEAASVATATTTPEVLKASPLQRSCRSRPYPEPKCKSAPSSPGSSSGGELKVKPLPSAVASDESAPLRPTKIKKLKKMEQNKTAATRYRHKKKCEKEDLLKEYSALERKNMELTEKADSMAREIAYLKELMEEVRQARINKGHAARP